MKTYEIQNFGIDELGLTERAVPEPGPREVLVKLHAVSLNYRDLMMVSGQYNPKLKRLLVPFSDGAGEVVAVGAEVSRWKVGQRVCPIFMQGWIDGEIDFAKARTALGGDQDGCLREFGVFDETGLVPIPNHLSYEEASTLPCAGVTAWHALQISGKLKPSETVLLLGTGGVSIFALQFARMSGAQTIITSSSDEKLERARGLGADHVINYRQDADWEKHVLDLTDKRGVDHVVEVGGAGTLGKSLQAVRMGGHIAVIGVLDNEGEVNPVPILGKSVRLQGIYVGSRVMFEQMNAALEQQGTQPIVDKVFEFGEVREALRTMQSGSHFGKIVVKVD